MKKSRKRTTVCVYEGDLRVAHVLKTRFLFDNMPEMFHYILTNEKMLDLMHNELKDRAFELPKNLLMQAKREQDIDDFAERKRYELTKNQVLVK